MEKCNADIVHFGFRNIYIDHKEEIPVCFDTGLLETKEYLRQFTKDWTCGLLWNKLYKRSLFENINFPEGTIIDDEFFTYRGVFRAQSIYRSNLVKYNYRKRKNGLMSSKSNQKRIIGDRINYLSARRKDIYDFNADLGYEYDYNFWALMLAQVDAPGFDNDNLWEIIDALKDYNNSLHSYKIGLHNYIKLILAIVVRIVFSHSKTTFDSSSYDK